MRVECTPEQEQIVADILAEFEPVLERVREKYGDREDAIDLTIASLVELVAIATFECCGSPEHLAGVVKSLVACWTREATEAAQVDDCPIPAPPGRPS